MVEIGFGLDFNLANFVCDFSGRNALALLLYRA